MARHPDPAKKEKLINSAIAAFVRHGYGDTYIATIAEGAGMVPSHVYTYFADKDALLKAVIRRMMEEHTEAMVELSQNVATMSESEYVDAVLAQTERIRPRTQFIIQCYLTPRLRPLFDDIDLDYSPVFLPYLQARGDAGAENTARALMALSDSYFLVGDTEAIKRAAVQLLRKNG